MRNYSDLKVNLGSLRFAGSRTIAKQIVQQVYYVAEFDRSVYVDITRLHGNRRRFISEEIIDQVNGITQVHHPICARVATERRDSPPDTC